VGTGPLHVYRLEFRGKRSEDARGVNSFTIDDLSPSNVPFGQESYRIPPVPQSEIGGPPVMLPRVRT
jgi:hypothetical protein